MVISMVTTWKTLATVGVALSATMLLRGQSVETNRVKQNQGMEAPSLISGALTEAMATKYVKSTGSPIGKGPVQQFQADLGVGKYVTITGWQDYDIGRRAMDEVDADFTLHKDQLYRVKVPHLQGNIAASVSFQYWDYPSRLINSHNDQALITTMTYTGPVTVKFIEKHMLTGGLAGHGNNYVFDVSKPFEVFSSRDSKLAVGPTFRTAYDDRFFKYNGWNIVTPGASLNFTRRNLSIDVSEKCELREDVPPSKKEGFWYSTVSATLRF